MRYLLAVVLTALLGGLCEELLPARSALAERLRLVSGICVLAALVQPLGGAIASLGSLIPSVELGALLDGEESGAEDYEALLDASLGRYASEEAARLLAHLIEERFGLRAASCRVEMTLREDGTVGRVLVTLSGLSVLTDPREICDYVSERLGCPCDVAVE